MGNQKDRVSRSPRLDKLLSYERDCRDSYGENNKSKRKAIPRFKAASNRQGRHLSKSVVKKLTGDERVDEEVKLAEADCKALHPWKRKSPDMPLEELMKLRKKRSIS